ncbi:MAG: hypothetical protein AAGE84_25805 [Cyanobacteria bacterium P01_G01_bin.39]
MEQPKNSKIKFTKTDDALDIYIPPPRFRSSLTIIILGMEFIFSFPILLMAYRVYAAEFPFKIACAAFSLPFLAGAIGIAPDIILQTEDKEYKLSSYTHFELSEAELDWLAYEISNFWKLPITQESFEALS